MRVHPSNYSSRSFNWQTPAVLILLLGMLVSELVPTTKATLQTNARDVVMARKDIFPGEIISESALTKQTEDISDLPSDAVFSAADVLGKEAVLEIPEGTPLRKASVSKYSKAFVSTSEPKRSVVVMLPQVDGVPPAGARVAISLQGSGIQLLVEDAWLVGQEGKVVRVKVSPQDALLLEEAKTYNLPFSYVELPLEGDSPFRGLAIGGVANLRKSLAVHAQTKNYLNENVTFSGYGYSNNAQHLYTIGPNGNIQVVDKNGRTETLAARHLQLPPGFLDSGIEEQPE